MMIDDDQRKIDQLLRRQAPIGDDVSRHHRSRIWREVGSSSDRSADG